MAWRLSVSGHRQGQWWLQTKTRVSEIICLRFDEFSKLSLRSLTKFHFMVIVWCLIETLNSVIIIVFDFFPNYICILLRYSCIFWILVLPCILCICASAINKPHNDTSSWSPCTENYSNNQTSPTGWWLPSADDHEKPITRFEVIPSGIWGADVTKVKVGAAQLGPAVQQVKTHFMSGQDAAHNGTRDNAELAPVEPAPVEPALESDGVTYEVTVLTRDVRGLSLSILVL